MLILVDSHRLIDSIKNKHSHKQEKVGCLSFPRASLLALNNIVQFKLVTAFLPETAYVYTALQQIHSLTVFSKSF